MSVVKYYEVDAENRICVTADTAAPGAENPQSYDFPDDFPFDHQSDYKMIDGEPVYDPLPETEQPAAPINEAATWDELAAAIKEGVNTV